RVNPIRQARVSGAIRAVMRPETIVVDVADVAWHREQLDWKAALGVLCDECHGRIVTWTGGRNATGQARETVLARCPLGDSENTGIHVVSCLCDATTILGTVQPVVGILAADGLAMKVLNADSITRVDGKSACA